jgi:rhodanese-related sulfurtransferase
LQDGISTWNSAENVWPTGKPTNGPLPVTTKGLPYHGLSPTMHKDKPTTGLETPVINVMKSINRNYPPGFRRPYTITPSALETAMNSITPPLVVDLRPQKQFAKDHIPSSINIPFEDLGLNLSRLPKSRPIVLVSSHMQKAAQACILLRMLGYNTYLLQQGLALWDSNLVSAISTANYPIVQN